MGEVCPHEIPTSLCATCAGVPRDDTPEGSRPFRARYSGTCGGCGFTIDVGDAVHYLEDCLTHEGCP